MSMKSTYIISALFFAGIVGLLIHTSMERKEADARAEAISKANAERASEEADRAIRNLDKALADLDIEKPSAKLDPDLMLMMRQNVEQMELFCRQGIPDSCEQARLQRKHYNELTALP